MWLLILPFIHKLTAQNKWWTAWVRLSPVSLLTFFPLFDLLRQAAGKDDAKYLQSTRINNYVVTSRSAARKRSETCISVEPQFSASNFSKFHGPVCQILQLTAANVSCIAINILWLPNPTKYAVFVLSNRNWQIQSVCQISRQYFSSAQYPITARVAVAYFEVQSCLHIVINYLWPPEPNQNMPYLSPYYWPVPNSATLLY